MSEKSPFTIKAEDLIKKGKTNQEIFAEIGNPFKAKGNFKVKMYKLRKKLNIYNTASGSKKYTNPEVKETQSAQSNNDKEQKSWDVKDDSATFEYKGSQRITNLEEALAFCKVDLNVWEVERHIFNSWQTTLGAGNGNYNQATNFQVKIYFRRRRQSYEQLKTDLIDSIKEISTPVKTFIHYNKKGNLLELDIFDPHFGKLAWAAETGEDYDLKIAEQRYMNAIYDLLEKSSGYKIKQILYPTGNDFFHYDNLGITTTAGTRQDTDSRWQKMFKKGVEVSIKTAKILAQVAPVHILHVPSNHDEQTGFYLAEVLAAHFYNSKNVIVDTSVTGRKYYKYGKCGIGFTHGHNERINDLATIMLRENQKTWSDVKFMEWHLGHIHKKKEIKYLAFDEAHGIAVRYLRSISGADAWHYKMGYVKGLKGAEAFIWDPDFGNVANISSIVL